MGGRIQRCCNNFALKVYNHVINHVNCKEESEEYDKPWWMLTKSDKFSVGFTWDCIRQNGDF